MQESTQGIHTDFETQFRCPSKSRKGYKRLQNIKNNFYMEIENIIDFHFMQLGLEQDSFLLNFCTTYDVLFFHWLLLVNSCADVDNQYSQILFNTCVNVQNLNTEYYP